MSDVIGVTDLITITEVLWTDINIQSLTRCVVVLQINFIK